MQRPDPAQQARWVRQSERRRLAAGARRMPGGMLTAEGAAALAELMEAGWPSKAAAISHALVVAARRLCPVDRAD